MCDLHPHNDDLPPEEEYWAAQVYEVLDDLDWEEISEQEALQKILGICQREVEK
jgi:hypothetical protein